MPPNKTWKAAERRVAEFFGTIRNRLSGSSGRANETRSDSLHERLFIETKYRAIHTTRSLHDDVKILAKKEGKIPVLALVDKDRPGFLVCIHSDDVGKFSYIMTAMMTFANGTSTGTTPNEHNIRREIPTGP